ncbi:hypothetical protein EYF80_060021 [Liparis tanakae]|uniref:Uncharacterized protein n=1 Tax=Liparis tanakae TaxID=230148 RepID=A0A4Z2EMN4_9TELE|nr:hypothetical protein EYF80_060021 [Liparis tanakae]
MTYGMVGLRETSLRPELGRLEEPREAGLKARPVRGAAGPHEDTSGALVGGAPLPRREESR